MNTCGGFAVVKQDIPWDVGDERQKYNQSLRQKISLISLSPEDVYSELIDPHRYELISFHY